MTVVPERFAARITELHAEAGNAWLGRLPALLERCADRWSLTVREPFQPLSYSFVAPAVRSDGTEVVLKLSVPGAGVRTEIEALRHFGGVGAARLLASDPEEAALLLERLEPGTPLSDLQDERRTVAIAARVMRRLWRPPGPGHGFPSIRDWAAGLERARERSDGRSPIARDLLETAIVMSDELIDSMAEPVLLHGDLHHDNILTAEREPWLAIDPKGVIGEPAFEVGAFLRNPMGRLSREPDPKRILERRADLFAEALELDRQRLLSWGAVSAVLAAWWAYEDHGSVGEVPVTLAEQLFELT